MTHDRRQFLARLTGAALAAPPLLRAFEGRAFALGPAPKRIVFVYSANGTVASNFFPADGEEVTARPILKPLAAHKNDVTVIRGLGYAGFNTPHEMGTTKALTNYDAYDVRPSGTPRGKILVPSLDQVLSKSIGAKSLRPVLRIGAGWGNERGWVSFGEDGTPIQPVGDAAKSFEYVFGVPPANAGNAEALRELRKSVLDVISKDAASIKARLPKTQAPKMDAALEAIRELERNLVGTAPGARADLPPRCREPAPPLDDSEHKKQASVIAAAFGCDVTRVVTWKLIGSADGRVPGLDASFHNTSHSQGKPDADAKLTYAHGFFATQIAELATRLKATSDPLGSGSAFDSTVIFWCNECGHGNHSPGNLPLVLVGNAGGAFKTGRLVRLSSPESNKYGNLLVSLANAVGDPMTTFGDKRWSTGPLQALAAG